MSDIVHLTVKGEKFAVPRDILLNSAHFKQLLDIQDNNLDIQNIDPLWFKLMILELTETLDVKQEMAKLCDFLVLDKQINVISELYCKMENCNRVAGDDKYCIVHKCDIEGCVNRKMRGYFCVQHTRTYRYPNDYARSAPCNII